MLQPSLSLSLSLSRSLSRSLSLALALALALDLGLDLDHCFNYYVTLSGNAQGKCQFCVVLFDLIGIITKDYYGLDVNAPSKLWYHSVTRSLWKNPAPLRSMSQNSSNSIG